MAARKLWFTSPSSELSTNADSSLYRRHGSANELRRETIGDGKFCGNFKLLEDWNCKCDDESPCKLNGRSRRSPCSTGSAKRAKVNGVAVGDGASTGSSPGRSSRILSNDPRAASSISSRSQSRRSELCCSGFADVGRDCGRGCCDAEELTAGPSSSESIARGLVPRLGRDPPRANRFCRFPSYVSGLRLRSPSMGTSSFSDNL